MAKLSTCSDWKLVWKHVLKKIGRCFENILRKLVVKHSMCNRFRNSLTNEKFNGEHNFYHKPNKGLFAVTDGLMPWETIFDITG